MIVDLPNGQELEFPDGTSPEVMRNAIHKNFPEYAAMYKGKTETRENESEDKDALRYAIQDPLIGLLNFGSRGAASVNNLSGALGEKLGNKLPETLRKHLPYSPPKQEATDFSEMLGLPREQQNAVDKIMQFGGEIAPALLAPETEIPWVSNMLTKLPGWGKYLKTALGNATTQGGIAALQSPNDQGKAALEAGAITAPFSALAQGILSPNPALRNISRALMAGGVGTLGYMGAKNAGLPEPIADFTGILGGALGAKGINAKRRAAEDVLKGVEGTDYQSALEAGKRLGMDLTPGEASGSPFAGGTQGSLGKTEPGAQLLHEFGTEREGNIEKSIDSFLGNIFTKEKLETKKTELYEAAKVKEVPKADLEKLNENEVFKDAEKIVQSDSSYRQKLKGVPKNSIEYLDYIKKAMDDMRSGKINKGKNYSAGIVKEAKDELTSIADNASPEYKQGRQISEREITRRKIEDAFDNKPMNAENFAKLLSSKKQYGTWQNKFKRLEKETKDPEQIKNMKNARQQLEDMRSVFGRLIPIPTAKTAEALARKNPSEGHTTVQEAMRYFKQILSGEKYDKAAVELITDPKWVDKLADLKKITNQQKFISAFHNLMGKAGAQAVAQ